MNVLNATDLYIAFFKSFDYYCVYYLKFRMIEKGGDTHTEIFHLLVYCTNTRNKPGQIRIKPRTRNST